MNQLIKIPNGIYHLGSSSIQANYLSFNFNQFYNILVSPILYANAGTEDGYITSLYNFATDKETLIDLLILTSRDDTYVFIVFGNIIYVDVLKDM